MFYIYVLHICRYFMFTIYIYCRYVLYVSTTYMCQGRSGSSWSLSLFLVSLSLLGLSPSLSESCGHGNAPLCQGHRACGGACGGACGERAEERAVERARERAREHAGSVEGSVGGACGSAHRLIIRAEKEKRAKINCTKKPKLLRIAQDEQNE